VLGRTPAQSGIRPDRTCDDERRTRRNAVNVTSILQAAGLFFVTNVDDIIVLSLFFARGAGRRGTTTRILAGQYLGFGGILLASVAVTFGAGLFLPDSAIPYFGLIPLLLGLYAAWRTWRRGHDEDEVADKPLSVLLVAAVTFANGGDNIGVYVPVFLAVGTGAVAAFCVVFLGLVVVLVATARFVATRKPVAAALERWEHILFPLVLILLGLVILVEGGAFGL
jgi:cadmium resistance protein CadD (predicted permease)